MGRRPSGKNSTDSALIIDAMDLLHGGGLQGFCLVSSDSDFTRLANRIREAGLTVYGFGEKKTPDPFVAACDKFVYTEILRPRQDDPGAAGAGPDLRELLTAAATAAARDNGWAPLSTVGSLVAKNSPSFDPRNYGFQKLGELVRRQSFLEVKEVAVGDSAPNVHLYVRLRRMQAAVRG